MHHNMDVGVANDCQELETQILSNSDIKSIGFETKPNRHGLFSGMYFEQYCYDASEQQVINKIRKQHLLLDSSREDEPVFAMESSTKWFGLLECSKPSYAKIYEHLQSQSFSMPTAKAKDATTHPVWSVSHRAAKKIANWQAERSLNQNPDLMNDPAMLVFEELKIWFLQDLSKSECHSSTIEKIANRKHYLNNVFYLLTNLNKDKRQLLSVTDLLTTANHLVEECIQDKRSPEILNELIINIDTITATLANYLHFLLIDENVTDNFSLNSIQSGDKCISPLCKIFGEQFSQIDKKFLPTTFRTITSSDANIKQIEMDLSRLQDISFAPTIKQSDKVEYLKASTYLELLIELQQTFLKIKSLQLKIGSFTTTLYFKEKIQHLTNNLFSVLDACKSSMQNLFESANQMKKFHLNSPSSTKKPYYMRNLETIETILAKGTTMEDKFNHVINDVINISAQYQTELNKLSQKIADGTEQREINNEVAEVIEQLNHINMLIPSIIQKKAFSLYGNKNINLQFDKSHNKSFSTHVTTNCLPEVLKYKNETFKWDKVAKFYPGLNQPIYTLRSFINEIETGHIEFYAKPFLCFSADATRHNALNFTGIFADYLKSANHEDHPICHSLPETNWSILTTGLTYSAYYGVARGVHHSVAKKIHQQHFGQTTSIILSQLFYMTSLFSINFAKHYEGHEVDQVLTSCIQASIDTGNMMLTSTVINSVNLMLNTLSEKLTANNHPYLGKTVSSFANVSWYGMYALNSFRDGFWNTSIKTAASITTEKAASFLTDYLLGTG